MSSFAAVVTIENDLDWQWLESGTGLRRAWIPGGWLVTNTKGGLCFVPVCPPQEGWKVQIKRTVHDDEGNREGPVKTTRTTEVLR